MQAIRVKEKVKVFISSNIGEKYACIREALKLLLTETNMCEVYMFEDEGATSTDVVSSYMRKLERSDIVVYLIDNKDGIGEGTLKEVKRGRELKKKSLFLFCDENEKESTELQKEIIKMNGGEKFRVVSKFVNMPEIAYESVINDIINTYLNYCNMPVEISGSLNEGSSIETTIGDIHAILNKEEYKNYDYTKWTLRREISVEPEYSRKIEMFDKLCSDLLSVVLGNKVIDEIDFDSIKKHIKDIHEPGNLQKTIMLRIDAFEAYWHGNIKYTISLLAKSLDIALDTKKIPQWLVNDIAIDLRNMNVICNQENNIFEYPIKGQDVLNESQEPVFNPIVDRFASNYYENVIKEMLENLVDSPFSVKLGGIGHVLDQIVDIYIASLLYGSITHISLIQEKIIMYLQGLCFQYRNHKFIVTIIKLLLLSGDKNKLSKFIEAYGLCSDNINAEDIIEWKNAVSKISIKYRRINALCLLWGTFGMYFSDELFCNTYAEIKKEINIWMDEQYACDLISKAYLLALEKNQYRIEQNDFIKMAILYYDKGLKRWYNDVFYCLSRVHLDKMDSVHVNKYVTWIKECIKNEDIKRNCSNLPFAIQNIRLQRDDVTELDELVKVNYKDFYDNEYSLNIFEHDLDEINVHIEKLVNDIKNENKTQGENGCYSKYESSPHRTIENILVMGKEKVRVTEIAKVLEAAFETLLAERQTTESKFNAIRLITVIFMIYPNAKCAKATYEKLAQNEDVCLRGNDIFLSNGYKDSTLQIANKLLSLFYNKEDELSVIETFSEIATKEPAEIIIVLNMLCRCFEVAEKYNILVNHIQYILQSLLEFSRNPNSDIRFYAYISLIRMMRINKECNNVILLRLSEAMDNEIYKNKVAILSRLIKKHDKKIDYIFAKGKADNHFWVRDVASR